MLDLGLAGLSSLAPLASLADGAPTWNTGLLYTVTFCLFAAMTLVSSVMLLAARDVVRAAFLLLGALGGVAGLYAMLGADFLAFVQILVYIGGILILLLFGVMLTNREPVLLHGAPTHRLVLPGVVASLVALFGILFVMTSYDWGAAPIADKAIEGSTGRPLGELLMTDYLLPFEISSVLLLIALIGAAVIARRRGLTAEPE